MNTMCSLEQCCRMNFKELELAVRKTMSPSMHSLTFTSKNLLVNLTTCKCSLEYYYQNRIEKSEHTRSKHTCIVLITLLVLALVCH